MADDDYEGVLVQGRVPTASLPLSLPPSSPVPLDTSGWIEALDAESNIQAMWTLPLRDPLPSSLRASEVSN